MNDSTTSRRELRAIRWRITSVSLVVWKIEPSLSRRWRISTAFVRLPLWTIPAAERGLDDDRLGVGDDARPRGRVAGVTEGARAGQATDHLLPEDVRDLPHAALDPQVLAVPADDPRALLPRCCRA